MGRGMGRRAGGAYSYQAPTSYIEPKSKGSEEDVLKERLELIEEELRKIRKRLEDLKN
jgi:hypothetical protein